MIITQTPFRMSFFGGGTDMESFFRENGGAVLSTTFDKYCYVNVRHLPRFFDYSTELSYSKTERVTCIEDIQHPAIRNAMKMLDMQRIINYGSFLQAYGLKKMIESVSKSEVEFIDYRFGVDITNRLKKPQSKAESIVDKILKNRTPWNYLKKKNFFKEIERNLILDLKDIGVDKLNYDCDVDTLVIGSDEVFNCLQPYPVGYSKQLFGDGYAHSKIVSYAASFGSTRYEDLVDTGIAHEIKTMLSRFAAISVRDENSAHIVRQLLGYSPEIHMDPVLMYDFTQEIAEYTTYERDYIILYAYTGRLSREEENYIKKFAKRHNKRIICVGHYSNIADKNIICNPLYVFSYFKNADYVITDTFHGTVFSIKMNTKFCTLVRDSNRNKLEALLNKLDKLERKVEKLEDIERLYNTEVDFYKTNQIIEQERKKTTLYLKENI